MFQRGWNHHLVSFHWWFLVSAGDLRVFFLIQLACPNLSFFWDDASVHGGNNLVLNQYLEDVAATPIFWWVENWIE